MVDRSLARSDKPEREFQKRQDRTRFYSGSQVIQVEQPRDRRDTRSATISATAYCDGEIEEDYECYPSDVYLRLYVSYLDESRYTYQLRGAQSVSVVVMQGDEAAEGNYQLTAYEPSTSYEAPNVYLTSETLRWTMDPVDFVVFALADEAYIQIGQNYLDMRYDRGRLTTMAEDYFGPVLDELRTGN